MSFAGKVILITGGLGGIGFGIAEYFAAREAKVVISGIGRDRGEAAVVRVGQGSIFVPLDVTSEAQWSEALATIDARHGRLDILVNCAGVFKPGIPFLEMSLADWRRHMSVNLDGAFLGCRFGIKAIGASGGGSIVNISSGLAEIMLPDGAAYCVSKSALLPLTQLAAKVGAPHKVRVNAILPGAVDTPMMWCNLRPGQTPQDLLDILLPQHPIGRIGVPLDVANAVDFLCADASGFVTGAMLAVDGGQIT